MCDRDEAVAVARVKRGTGESLVDVCVEEVGGNRGQQPGGRWWKTFSPAAPAIFFCLSLRFLVSYFIQYILACWNIEGCLSLYSSVGCSWDFVDFNMKLLCARKTTLLLFDWKHRNIKREKERPQAGARQPADAQFVRTYFEVRGGCFRYSTYFIYLCNKYLFLKGRYSTN